MGSREEQISRKILGYFENLILTNFIGKLSLQPSQVLLRCTCFYVLIHYRGAPFSSIPMVVLSIPARATVTEAGNAPVNKRWTGVTLTQTPVVIIVR